MEVEKFRGLMAALVAAACVVGGAIGASIVWYLSVTISPPPETTLIFGIFTGLIGTGGTYLFITDSASRASHATERGFTQGTTAGSTMPEQAPGTTTTITTPPEPEPVAAAPEAEPVTGEFNG